MAGVSLLAVRLPDGFTGGISTRRGGYSKPPYAECNLGVHVGDEPAAVAANRRLLAQQVGATRIRFGAQVHGDEVHEVTAAEVTADGDAVAGDESTVSADPAPRCDALVCALPGIALGVLVADCVPVLFADATAGVVAVAHAGRRGLVAGVLQRTVAAMAKLGSDPAAVVAVVGPAIGGCCYEVPAELQEAVAAAVPDVASRTSWGTPSLDLPRGALAVLQAAGVGAVQQLAACTAEDACFYSYRRDGVTGRFAGVVVRR